MMKRNYTTPKIKISESCLKDVISTSSFNGADDVFPRPSSVRARGLDVSSEDAPSSELYQNT